jgi:hypothetical protein
MPRELFDRLSGNSEALVGFMGQSPLDGPDDKQRARRLGAAGLAAA